VAENSEIRDFVLYGRIFLRGAIQVITGLHIGIESGPLSIGGVDLPMIRNPITNEPYIPGSSLKGKLRSLSEKVSGQPMNSRIGSVSLHVCDDGPSYRACPVCPVFGVPGQKPFSEPTRVIVRDVALDEQTRQKLQDARLDRPFAELKAETAIDRVTAHALPRVVERVPAGAVFAPFELVYSIYEAGDLARFRTLIRALLLLEDDYLGGQGSRGSGKIRFVDLSIFAKPRAGYESPEWEEHPVGYPDLTELAGWLDSTEDENGDQSVGILDWLAGQIPVTPAGQAG